MSDDEDLKLNTLHRFSKHSKLVLESHSHCEVPAGCGGAVLSWVNPARTMSLRLETSTSLTLEALLLDGEPVRTSRLQLTPGEHVLAVRLLPAKKPEAPPHVQVLFERATSPEQLVPLFGSTADGTWRLTATAPPADWVGLAFDDRAWAPLTAARLTGVALDRWAQNRLNRLATRGAQALAVPAGGGWLRKRFTIPEPA